MLVDVHSHLDAKQFKNNLDSVIQRAKNKSVKKIITNGTNIKSNRKTLEISKKYSMVEAALGLFPSDALKLSDIELEKEIEFIKKNKKSIIAIGECGLDYHWNKNHKKQKQIFEKFIKLSEKLNLSVKNLTIWIT